MAGTEITISLANLLYICTAISIVGGAIKILWEAKKSLQKPLDEIDAKFEHYDKCLKNDQEHFEQVDRVLENLTQSMNMLIKSHRTVLYHMQDGNHTGEITREIEELDDWLLQGKEYKR